MLNLINRDQVARLRAGTIRHKGIDTRAWPILMPPGWQPPKAPGPQTPNTNLPPPPPPPPPGTPPPNSVTVDRSGFQFLDNDLRDLVASCMAIQAGDRPGLQKLLDDTENAVRTRGPAYYGVSGLY